MDDNLEFCETQTHVKPWKLLTLEPINVLQVSNLLLITSFMIDITSEILFIYVLHDFRKFSLVLFVYLKYYHVCISSYETFCIDLNS